MLRVALVGTGDAGKHHARALASIASEGAVAWTAICGRDATRLDAFRAEQAVPKDVLTFASLEAVIEARACDAVILATPDGIHAEQVERAARAGLHVLVEKPLALSRADGERAVASARVSDVYLAVGYQLRHHGAHRIIAARMGELVGPLRSIFVKWAWPDPATEGWRARRVGARFWSLAALGTHGIDLSLWLASASAGAPVEATDVVAMLEPREGDAPDRAAEVTMRIGTALAHVSVSVVHRAASRVLISGDAGELEAVGTLGARGDGELFHRAPRQPAVAIAFEPVNPYAAQLRDFAARARHGFASDPSLLGNLHVLDRISPGEIS